MENIRGIRSRLDTFNFPGATVLLVVAAVIFITGCGGGPTTTTGRADANETAATVNGKAITMEEVERAFKQQAQGQENRLSPLEVAAARLQVLQGLIEQEVMFQKAEKESTVPTDEEVTAELNRQKTQSGKSADQIAKDMSEAGVTEANLRDQIKRQLAIQRLTEKITGRIEPPKDSEVESFYNSNKESFKNKRGAQLAAIVIDPTNSGPGDTTTSDVEAQQRAKEIGSRVMSGADFATVAREASEESNTRLQGGDWRYFTEDELRQAFGASVADYVMNKMQNGQIIPSAIPFEGKILIVKLQRKLERDEDRTLETPGVRKEIADYLINSRKQLLAASYQAIAMNEAEVENFLARKVAENPNELSGARPAPPANATATPAATSNPANVNSGTTANSNAAANRSAVNTNSNPRPAAAANTNRPAANNAANR
ncbi:MAG: SurA N-terminal domain-containing protein [Acidobacteria bacterium]|nr:SurA N-terminal domain-containing protein [Acidobacteriota bacterium]MCA1608671.1 SurA N-terminal domain-containing protein [Acidobacteriota bacterium]